jgi:Zn-dependent peptidase ImmA (M78 family)
MTSDKSLQKIYRSLGYKLQGGKKMQKYVVEVVAKLPEKVSKQVTHHCWFISSYEDAWGFALRQDDLKKGDCLIYLNGDLFEEDADQIRYTIAHEIGHFVLGHKNSITVAQTKDEIKKQEHEADEFAKRYAH